LWNIPIVTRIWFPAGAGVSPVCVLPVIVYLQISSPGPVINRACVVNDNYIPIMAISIIGCIVIIGIIVMALIRIVVIIPVRMRVPGAIRAPVVREIIGVVIPVSVGIAVIKIKVGPNPAVLDLHTQVTVIVIVILVIVIPVVVTSAAMVLAVVFLIHLHIIILGFWRPFGRIVNVVRSLACFIGCGTTGKGDNKSEER
jgi:hypothetical protein